MKPQDASNPDLKPFEGDRYDRLQKAAEVLAADENIATGEPPFNSEGLRAFATTIRQLALFEGLSESDADFAGMLLLLDFPRGLQHMSWRVGNLLSEQPDVPHDYDDETAVIATYVDALSMLLGAFRAPDPHRTLARLAAEAADVYDMLKQGPGNAGDFLRAARDSIADAQAALW
jgi:hypothetical protein